MGSVWNSWRAGSTLVSRLKPTGLLGPALRKLCGRLEMKVRDEREERYLDADAKLKGTLRRREAAG